MVTYKANRVRDGYKLLTIAKISPKVDSFLHIKTQVYSFIYLNKKHEYLLSFRHAVLLL